MGPFSIHDPAAGALVEEWLAKSSELLAEYYIPHSGGGGNYYLLSSMAQFQALADKMWAGEVLFILRAPQFPLGGVVDEDFIRKAESEMIDGGYYLVVEPFDSSGLLALLGSGDTRAELKADLEGLKGKFVRLGPEPRLPEKYWQKDEDPGCLILRGQ